MDTVDNITKVNNLVMDTVDNITKVQPRHGYCGYYKGTTSSWILWTILQRYNLVMDTVDVRDIPKQQT